MFLIINKDQYEMKSIDKLHYKFLAGLSEKKCQESNFGNNV